MLFHARPGVVVSTVLVVTAFVGWPIWGDTIEFKAGDRAVTTEQTPVQATHGVVATLEAGAELLVADVKQGWVGITAEQKGQRIAGWVRPKSLALAPASPGSMAFDRGYGFHQSRDYDKALAEYTEAIGLDPKFARAYSNRGLVYQAQHDSDRAIADFSQAIRLLPTLGTAYLNRGAVYSGKGDHDKAIADFSEAIRIDPNSVEAYRFRAGSYEAKGEKLKALTDLARAAKAYRPKYDTIAHKVVRIELQVKGAEYTPNFEFIDMLIDEAKTRIKLKRT